MKKVVSIIAVLAIATAAQAAVVASFTSATSSGPAGFTTYEVWLTSDSGTLNGFELSVDADSGSALRQDNPFGSTVTIFTDNNAVIVGMGGAVDRDSQFNYASGDVLAITTSLIESTTQLAGTFAWAGGTGDSNAALAVNILHISMLDGDSAVLSGKVTVGSGPTEVIFSNLTIPEPASMALLGMGGISMLIRRKR